MTPSSSRATRPTRSTCSRGSCPARSSYSTSSITRTFCRGVVAGRASPAVLDTFSQERVQAAHDNIAYGAKSTEFMAPPHAGFRLMREAALRLALEEDAVRALINPRQSSPVAYRGSAVNQGDATLVGEPAPDARLVDASSTPTHLTALLDGSRYAVLWFDESDRPLPSIDGVNETSSALVNRAEDVSFSKVHRGDRIRTCDLLVPNQAF